MEYVVGRKTRPGAKFARAQRYALGQMGLNKQLASKMIEMVGATWAVRTFECYLANREKFGGRAHLEPYLRDVLHVEHMTSPDDFPERMRFIGLIPLEVERSRRSLTNEDCERILSALRYFVARY